MLGLRPAEFWDLTWNEYLSIADGYHRREADKWRHTRWLGTILLNVHRGEGEDVMTPEEVMPLPGDVLPLAAHVLTPAEIDAEFVRLLALDTDLLPAVLAHV